MTAEKAMELRKAQKQFWANWKKISNALKNETNCGYSWQYYAGLEGVGNPSIYPEATNYELGKYIIEGVEPSEEILYILNY